MHESGTGRIAGPTGRLGAANDAKVRRRPGRRAALLVVVSAAALVAALVVTFLATRPPAPKPIAIYSHGQATLVINGLPNETLRLVSAGATLLSPDGASLAWQSGDGWYLNLNGPFGFTPGGATPASTAVASGSTPPGETPPDATPPPPDANGSLQLAGGDVKRWAGFDSRACVILYSEVSRTTIAGSIRCQGLVWYDGSAVEHIQPLDLAPFDINVTFEATGSGVLPQPSTP